VNSILFTRSRRRDRRGLVWVCVSLLPLLPVPAWAQVTPRHAAVDLIQANSPVDVGAVAAAVANQIASVPLGSSSGGFTYTRDTKPPFAPKLKTDTFGPSFAERPTTLGEPGAWSFGVSFLQTRFESFEGIGLRNGDLKVQALIDGKPRAELFTTTLDVTTASTIFVANVGVASNVDIGVTIPWVRLGLNGVRSVPFDPRPAPPVALSTTGIGDVQARVKWAPIQTPTGGLAGEFEVRIPSGDPEKLIGGGEWLPRVLLLASTTQGPISPHVNLSYQFGAEGALVSQAAGGINSVSRAQAGDELGYTFGVEIKAHPTVTLSAELIGRSLKKAARFQLEDRSLPADMQIPTNLAPFTEAIRAGRFGLRTLNARVDSLNTWFIAAGIKTTVLRNGLVRFDVLSSRTDEGLRPGLTTLFGFEYTFDVR
jgi:hypothetical protein